MKQLVTSKRWIGLVLCWVIVCIYATAVLAQSTPPLALARDDKAVQTITVSAKADAQTKAVAQELAGYLGRISGATFEVKPGDGSSGIVLGTLAQFPVKELEKPLEMRGAYDGLEAFAIRTEVKRVLLLGRTELGAAHAAHRFLETLGCRWFFPGQNWEVVPRKSELTYSVNESSRPAILSRRIWFGFGLFDDKSIADFANWSRRNRMAQSLPRVSGHAWQSIIAANQKEFEAHPEYLALVKQPDGSFKRQGPQFCTSQPAVRKMAVDYALNYLRQNPTIQAVSLEPSDGGGMCECELCKDKSIPDRVFGLANEAARAVEKEFPGQGKLVTLYAYYEHTDPPSFALEPNVFVLLTHGYNQSTHSFDNLVDLWVQKSKMMGYYEYFSVWQSDRDMPPFVTDEWQKQIAFYAAHNAKAIEAESSSNWGPRGVGYYIANKAMWNPQVDDAELLTDFYEKAFGPAAGAMRRHYERLTIGRDPLMGDYLIGLALRDLDEASTLAKDRPDVQARLDDLKSYWLFVQLKLMMDRETDTAKKREREMALLTHIYRTRYSYMEHYRAWTTWAMQDLAPRYGETGWGLNDTARKPWEDPTPYTHEDTARDFAAAREYFKAVDIEQKEYSNDLVPVSFPDAKSIPSVFTSDTVHLALYSKTGELLELELTPDKADGHKVSYTLANRQGKEIATAKLPADGEKRILSLKVPQPGVYFLKYSAPRIGGTITVPAGRPAVMVTIEGGTGSLPPRYFYVPKGTKAVQFFYVDQEGRPIQFNVRSPDGKIAAGLQTSGKVGSVYKVPVAEGQDGKVWWLDGLALGRLRFFNVPNILAASPDALLLPREVVEKDELPSP
jgi:hypothetical protein